MGWVGLYGVRRRRAGTAPGGPAEAEPEKPALGAITLFFAPPLVAVTRPRRNSAKSTMEIFPPKYDRPVTDAALRANDPLSAARRRGFEEREALWRTAMGKAQQGDGDAYRVLLEGVQAWLTGYFRGRVPQGTVDDLVQETMIGVHTKRATYDPSRPFTPWLAAIARYKWIDWLRRENRHDTTELSDGLADDTVREPGSADALAKLLAMLPAAQAEAIRLVKLGGYSVDEAAEASGQSPSLVKVNIHRGLKKLTKLAAED